MTKKHDLGQYFTPKHVAEFMVSLSRAPKDGTILEPSSGEGVFIKTLKESGFHNITAFEIDSTLEQIEPADIQFESFVKAEIHTEFDMVIGNPPYIRWRNLPESLKNELAENSLWASYFNSLCDYLYIFILKSVEHLKDGGELIFITPEYWINTKHSESLRNYLSENGYFTDIIHFNETPIFDDVASSIIIFRYIKSKKPSGEVIQIKKYLSNKRLTADTLRAIRSNEKGHDVEIFNRKQFEPGKRWTLIPSLVEDELERFESKCRPPYHQRALESDTRYLTLGHVADIGNGMVSGLDKAFQIPPELTLTENESLSTINVVKGKHMAQYIYTELTRYIFLGDTVTSEEQLQRDYPNFYAQLSQFKTDLDKRYKYNRDIQYWEWVFLRGYNLFRRNQKRIFVPCKERISHKNYFRFTLANHGIYPTQDVTAIFLKDSVRESVYFILALLNSPYVFNWLRHKGVVKGNIVEFSEKPLASIPMRLIDWSKPSEVALHDDISSVCEEYVKSQDNKLLLALEQKVAQLFN